jgi:HPt (histidine-containing phosphotransfer) domain-containing protein
MICGSFLEDIGEVLNNLRQSIEDKDYEAVRFNAHTLKGLCGNIDAETSIALSRQLEFAAKKGEQSADHLKPLFDKLLIELNKVKNIIT